MDLPEDNTEYGKAEYWNKRYARFAAGATTEVPGSETLYREEQYDWLAVYDHFSSSLENVLKHYHHSDAILHLGCGNSSLSGDLERVGWRNVTNIDISTVVLRNMKNQDKTAQTYLAMDMTNMPFRDQSFDIVIEKSTIDALLVTNKSPWDLNTPECDLVRKALGEIKRVLRRGGTFVSITFSQPHFRVPLLATQQLAWAVNVEKVSGQGLDCYLMSLSDGDPGPSLLQYSVPYQLEIVENESWESSDEERFLENLNIDSEPEDDDSWDNSA